MPVRPSLPAPAHTPSGVKPIGDVWARHADHHFTRTHLNSTVSLGHCTAVTFLLIAQVNVRR